MTERLKLVEGFRQSVAALVQQAGFLLSAIERGSYDADQRETLLTELGKAAAEVRQAVDGGVDALIRPTTGTRPGEWTSDLLRSMAALCDDLTTLALNWFAAVGSLSQRKEGEAEYRPILERPRQCLLELQAKSDYLSNFDTSVVELADVNRARPALANLTSDTSRQTAGLKSPVMAGTIDDWSERIRNWLQAKFHERRQRHNVIARYTPQGQQPVTEEDFWSSQVTMEEFHQFLLELGAPIEQALRLCGEMGWLVATGDDPRHVAVPRKRYDIRPGVCTVPASRSRTLLNLLRESFVSLRSRFQALADRGVECQAWVVEDHDHDGASIAKKVHGLDFSTSGFGMGACSFKPPFRRSHFQQGWWQNSPLSGDASRLIWQLPDDVCERLWASLPDSAAPIANGSEVSPWLWQDAVFELAFQAHDGSPLRAKKTVDLDALGLGSPPKNILWDSKLPTGFEFVCRGFPKPARVADPQLPEFVNEALRQDEARQQETWEQKLADPSWYAFLPNFASASVSAINVLLSWLDEAEPGRGKVELLASIRATAEQVHVVANDDGTPGVQPLKFEDLNERFQIAFRAAEFATDELRKIYPKRDKFKPSEMYLWLKQNAPEYLNGHDQSTWKKYVRDAKRLLSGESKASPRRGRSGRSIVSIHDIERSQVGD